MKKIDKNGDLNPVNVTLNELHGLQFEASGFSFLPKYKVQSLLAGRHKSAMRGRGLDFKEVRAYVAGDDIRNIDWKVTARTQKTHTKVFSEERERPVLLVVDQSSSMFFGTQQFLKSTISAHLCALGAWRTVEVGDRVGAFVFNDTEYQQIRPQRSTTAILQMLKTVEVYNQKLSAEEAPKSKTALLESVFQKIRSSVNHDYLIIIISDLRGISDKSLHHIFNLKRHNDVMIFHVEDEWEKDLPMTTLSLSNSEKQVSISNLMKKERDRQSKSFANDKELLTDQFAEYGIPLLTFTTSERASAQVRTLLKDH
ncbi:DUF58 domain-containing protein [Flammeovirga sp. MY04]|uniref:DUF58 domain-containing protein n=1 Tax=Flammeovirga sp. MY04 TaxID=1191459 RepID=UPI000806159E|nr:DUF58 domain-containing protein [Flammeovirga sp. MY04]ANQ50299.1 DUF58 domain-containing protein [Flammeovirga sp. MY04]